MTFFKWLNDKMDQLDITRLKFCELCGLSRSTIKQRRLKSHTPSLDTVLVICEVLTKQHNGDREYFDTLLMEVIATNPNYTNAIARLEK
jgi:transcriptional regulator with XRE-family HTH domain